MILGGKIFAWVDPNETSKENSSKLENNYQANKQ